MAPSPKGWEFVRDIRSLPTVVLAAGFLACGASFATAADHVGHAAPPVQVAQNTSTAEDDVNDPFEPINRVIFEFNQAAETMVLRPLSEFYVGLVAPPVREAIGNILDDLRTPVILAKDILQGESDRAFTTTERFVINTTVGFAGIVDRATEWGIPKHDEDFGQTLAVWGIDEMFYLVLPIFGPSSPRDAVGRLVVDPFFDPLSLYLDNIDEDEARYAMMGVRALDAYSGVMDDLAQIKKTSVDYYAAIRSLYRQRRKAEIANGDIDVDLPPIPEFSPELSYEPR